MSLTPGSVKSALAVTAEPSSEGSGLTVTAPTVGATLFTVWLPVFESLPVSSSVTSTVTV